MSQFWKVAVATLLLGLQAACAGPTATTAPVEQPEMTPTGPLGLVLNITAVPGTAGSTELVLTLANHGDKDVYLPICGPWEIYSDGDAEQPSWSLTCATDYLGHRVPSGKDWRDRLVVQLEPGTYHARTEVYGDCTLGPRKEYSPREIDYGDFGACSVQQEAVSPAFEVQ